MAGDVVTGVAPGAETPPSAAARRARSTSSIWMWTARRIILGIVTLWAVGTLVFVATQALPSNNVAVMLGPNATPEQIAVLQEQFGLDKPLIAQYATWLSNAAVLDFGDSLVAHQSVTSLISDRLSNSLVLVALAALISIPLSFVVGLIGATFRDRPGDHFINTVTLVLASLPDFVKGLLLVMVFSTTVFHLLPAVAIIPPGESPLQNLDALILPVAALSLSVVPYLSRLFRASMIEVLESEYIQVARLKGLGRTTVLVRHAAPNALVPSVQGSALSIAFLFGGSVVIEYLFRYPGLGAALVDAVNARDLGVVQVITLLFAAAFIVLNIIADLLTIYLTPRLRTTYHH